MTQKRKGQDWQIDCDTIFNEFSNELKTTFDELRITLHEESVYKCLKRFGEAQFTNAPNPEYNQESESHNRRISFANINYLAFEVYEDINRIIAEKFQGNFHNIIKQKVLKTILKLCPNNESTDVDNDDLILAGILENNAKKEEEKAVLEKIDDLSKFCAESLDDITKQVIEMPIEDNKRSSSDSSKDTLSSEIKEELMDINETTENLAEFKSSKQEDRKNSPNQGNIKKQFSASQSENSFKKSSIALQETSYQRIRKPNSKYFSYDASPAEKLPSEKISSSSPNSSMQNTLKRKRGRPRKSVT